MGIKHSCVPSVAAGRLPTLGINTEPVVLWPEGNKIRLLTNKVPLLQNKVPLLQDKECLFSL